MCAACSLPLHILLVACWYELGSKQSMMRGWRLERWFVHLVLPRTLARHRPSLKFFFAGFKILFCAFRHRSSIWIADFAAIFTPPTACRATAFHSAAFKRRRSDRTPGSGRQVGGVSRYGQHCELLTLEQPRPYAPAGLVDELLWAVACLSQLHERLLERRLHHFLEHWPDHTRVHRAHPVERR